MEKLPKGGWLTQGTHRLNGMHISPHPRVKKKLNKMSKNCPTPEVLLSPKRIDFLVENEELIRRYFAEKERAASCHACTNSPLKQSRPFLFI